MANAATLTLRTYYNDFSFKWSHCYTAGISASTDVEATSKLEVHETYNVTAASNVIS